MTPQQIIIVVSFCGGIIGGMGMGGGTLLIPLLTLAAGLSQHLAQSVNLIAFVPMSVVALFIHRKNGYVAFGKSAHIIFLALIGAVGGSFLAKYSGGYVLRACYGAFLILLGIFQAVKVIKTALDNKKQSKTAARGLLTASAPLKK